MDKIVETIRSKEFLNEYVIKDFRFSDYMQTIKIDLFDPRSNLNKKWFPDITSIVLVLGGIYKVEFTSRLSDSIRNNPAEVNWGINEISMVKFERTNEGCIIEFKWEVDMRNLIIVCERAELLEANSKSK